MARVLIVEDDKWLGDCYQRWLKNAGLQVARAFDAKSALNTLDAKQIDLVLLDLMLPFVNGIKFLNVLASHADLADIPVIVCSAALQGESLKNYGVKYALDKTTLDEVKLRDAVKLALKEDRHASV